MNLVASSGFGTCLCMCLAGCAILPAVGLNLAAQSAQGLVALTLGPMSDMQERSEADRCLMYTRRGIVVTESLEAAIPRDEGEITIFESVSWRPEFAREGYPQTRRSRTPTDGTLAISERAALLLPAPGATSIRIPFELVQNVRIEGGEATGGPRFIVVNSCFGRYDLVTFLRPPPREGEPEATADAAAQMTSRAAAIRAAGNN
jgi:hypothetical protein